MLPFAVTYAPLVMSNSKRSFSLVLEFTPTPRDIINVSAQNYVWSPILRWAEFKFGDREVQMGSPLIVLGLFVYFLVRQRSWPACGTRHREQIADAAGVLAVDDGGGHIRAHHPGPWRSRFGTRSTACVPGASALRALGRYLIVIDMIVVVAVVYGLNEFYRSQAAVSSAAPPIRAGRSAPGRSAARG